MYAKIKRTGAFLCAAALILWLMIGIDLSSVSAEGQGSITIICRSDDETLADMKWSIYKVGVREGGTSFAAEGDFRSYFVRIDDFSSEHLSDMAYTLENMAVLDELPAVGSGYTDENGKLTFSGLESGLYLLSGKRLRVSENVTYAPSPVLVEVNDEDVQISAKLRKLLTKGGEIISFTVKKVWDDQEDKFGYRPGDVTVEIYKDGELYQTIELNESNDWTYQWSVDEDYSDWRVKESDVPDGYTVIYRADDTQYAIVNSFDEDTPITTTTTAPEETTGIVSDTETTSTESVITTVLPPVTTVGSRLPQTGKLGWAAVPILAVGGAVIAAIALRKRNE